MKDVCIHCKFYRNYIDDEPCNTCLEFDGESSWKPRTWLQNTLEDIRDRIIKIVEFLKGSH